MRTWRGLLDRLLLGCAVMLVIVALAVIYSTIQNVRDTSTQFNQRLTYYVSRVESEAMEFVDALSRLEDFGRDSDLDQVIIRFDILWSRVFVEREVLLGHDTEASLFATQQIKLIRDQLLKMEPVLLSLRSGEIDKINALKQEIRDLMPGARQMRVIARGAQVKGQAAFLERQLRQAYLVFAMIVAMALIATLSTYLLRAERREIANMNSRLEDRVRQRTEDLQTANSRLGAEIQERQRNQGLAAEREARLDQAAQLAKLGYYSWNALNDRCEFCSVIHGASFGLSISDYMQKVTSRDAMLALIHKEDQKKVAESYQDLLNGHMIDIGYRVPLSLTVEKRLREVARPVLGRDGKVIRVVGSTLDVTDQYQTEMKLFESQKMDSIGKMTGGVAHDFNNLLAVIMGNLELMRELPDSAEREEMIEDAINATLRGRDLTMNMLSFARRAPLDPSKLELNQILSEMTSMMGRTFPQNIQIKLELEKGLWPVMADRSLTESAALNLAINARDAMPDGGRLVFKTENMTLDDSHRRKLALELDPGRYVVMSVTDTGRGIPPELMESIFEPFFTTKAIAKNSGLGLSMVQGFMQQTKGAVKVESSLDQGTTFRLYFKAKDAEVAAVVSSPNRAEPIVIDALRVLLVEDDDTVRKILTRQLEISGLDVVSASDGDAAEQIFASQGPFDIVVSDIIMPGGLQGPELVKQLRAHRPSLPAILLSGYPREALPRDQSVEADDLLLMKPVKRDALLASIQDAVRAAAETAG